MNKYIPKLSIISLALVALSISVAHASHVNPKDNLPLLHQAIINNDLDMINSLIKNGTDVNQLDSLMGNSPLHIAAQAGTPEIIDILVKNGAFVNLQTPKAGFSALMVASWYSKPENIKQLLSYEDININLKTPQGVKAEQLLGGWDKDIDKNELILINSMKDIFANYKKSLNKKLESNKIMDVVVNPNLTELEKNNLVKSLIEKGYSVNTVQPVIGNGNDRHSPLLSASRSGYTQIVKMLLEKGADQRQKGYMMDAIAFHKAAYMGHPEILELLVKAPYAKQIINAQGPNNGYTPLHDAIWHGHAKAAEVLINSGARLDLKTYEGDTPLYLAKRYKYDNIIKLLENKIKE